MKIFTSGKDRAFTVLELMVVVTVVAVLMMFFLATLSRGQEKAKQIGCVSNLKQIGLSFRMWANDHGETYPMQYQTNNFNGPGFGNDKQMFIYFQVMSNELSTPRILVCPRDEAKREARDFQSFSGQNFSYFVGLDVRWNNPQGFLSGDSNIQNGTQPNKGVLELTTTQTVYWTEARHWDSGNVALGDGSVQLVRSNLLQAAVANTGLATNRIVLPEDVK